MQTTSAAWTKAYNEGYVLNLKPQMYIEWNHNRFASTVTASNDPTTDQFDDTTIDPPVFVMNPISSIVLPNRPTAGIIKARTGQGKTVKSSASTVSYRVADNNSKYRYWISPVVSAATVTGAEYLLSNTSPTVIYGSLVTANKIVVGIENSLVSPTSYTVQITTNGTAWTTIATNPTINSDGRIILYAQSGGAWTTTPNLSNPQSIKGIRLNVTGLNRASTRFSLIEISARYRVDASADVISVDFSKTMSEQDMISPIGAVNTDSISLTLDNTTKNYDIENATGPYYGLLYKNAEVILSLAVDTTNYTGSGFEYLPFGTWYTESWNQSTDDATVTVPCSDISKFLQEEACANVLFVNRTPSQIIRNLLYGAGFKNFTVDSAVDEIEPIISYCWFSKEKTIWQAISDICKAQQTVFYIDENNMMRYRTRKHLFDAASGSPAYALSSIASGATLSNIETVDQVFATEANKVSVFYKNTYANTKAINSYRNSKPSDAIKKYINYTRDVPVTSVLWSGNDTISLQASDLLRSIDSTQNYIYIDKENAQLWPYKGMANIEGEIISWEGKEYCIYVGGLVQYKIVNSYADKAYWDLHSDILTMNGNSFTGKVVNVKRGLLGSIAAAHAVDIAGWTGVLRRSDNTVVSAPTRLSQSRSQIILHGIATDTIDGRVKALRGATGDQFKVYGARIRFTSALYTHGLGGIVLHSQSDNKAGYFFEFGLTTFMSKAWGGAYKEIHAYKVDAAGTGTDFVGHGYAYTIAKNQWMDIEITYDSTAHRFTMYVDGRVALTFVDSTYTAGKWGIYVRGDTQMAAEYFYAVKDYSALIPDPSKSSFQNKVTGGFESGYKDREIFKIRKRVQEGKLSRNYLELAYVFDDFGPIVHEVRQFKVDHGKTPALSRDLYCSNEWDAFVLEYKGTPFDSIFTIANAGRDVAILNGDDATVYVGQSLKQQLFVYGQVIIQDESIKISVQNDNAIRKNGPVELQFESDWIQSESQAKELAEFIKAHWADTVDTVTATGFFNPALQVGDYVTINYPDRSMAPSTHKYHVTAINGSVSNGLTMSLTLRRIR